MIIFVNKTELLFSGPILSSECYLLQISLSWMQSSVHYTYQITNMWYVNVDIAKNCIWRIIAFECDNMRGNAILSRSNTILKFFKYYFFQCSPALWGSVLEREWCVIFMVLICELGLWIGDMVGIGAPNLCHCQSFSTMKIKGKKFGRFWKITLIIM